MLDLNHLHFIRPWWFVVLLPLLLMIYFTARNSIYKNPWQQVCDPKLLPQLSIVNSKRSFLPLLLLSLAAIFAVFAFAGPSWHRITYPVYRSREARIVVFDLSPSMNAQDISPSRLTRAKYKILDLLKHFKDGQTGLVVFSNEPFIVSPLTQDSQTIAALIPSLAPEIMPVSGANIDHALEEATKLFQQAGVKKGNIILITNNKASKKAIQFAKKIHQKGNRISVLGIGTQKGAPIPLAKGGFLQDANGNIMITQFHDQTLKQLARAGDGVYAHFSANDQDLHKLLRSITFKNQSDAVKSKEETFQWKDSGRLFILPVLILGLLVFRKGWLRYV